MPPTTPPVSSASQIHQNNIRISDSVSCDGAVPIKDSPLSHRSCGNNTNGETPNISSSSSSYQFIYNVPISNLSNDHQQQDSHQQEDDTTSPVVQQQQLRTAIYSFIENLLLYKRNVALYVNTLEKAQDSMQAQILCAVFCLYNGKSPQDFIKQCANLKKKKQANLREKWLYQAVRAWYEGHLDRAIELHTKIAEKYPTDILSLFLCFNHYVYVHNSEKLVELFEMVEPHLHDDPYFLGMHCFVLSEAYEMQRAYEAGTRGYEILPHGPWIHHSLSHVYQELGQIDEGIRFMENNAHHWEDCIPFMSSHNWWHVGMLYLAKCKGPQDPTLKNIEQLIDNYTWYRKPDTEAKKSFNSEITVLAGIISLLWELDINGFSGEDSIISQKFFQELWESILPFVEAKTKIHVYPFFDIHFVYALSRMGDMERVQKYVSAIEQHGEEWNKNYLCDAWKRVLPAMSKGVVSFVLGDYSSAFQHMEPVHEQIVLLGGSNPQRHPMDETYIRSCLYNGEISQAVTHMTPNAKAKENRCVCQFSQCENILQDWIQKDVSGGDENGRRKRQQQHTSSHQQSFHLTKPNNAEHMSTGKHDVAVKTI